jgi:hypothetical protein
LRYQYGGEFFAFVQLGLERPINVADCRLRIATAEKQPPPTPLSSTAKFALIARIKVQIAEMGLSAPVLESATLWIKCSVTH